MKAIISQLQKFFRAIKNKILCLFSNDIRFTVDYTKTVTQLADCNIDYISRYITDENFPISSELIGKKVDVVGRLFYNRGNREEIIKAMDEEGFKPANLMESLAAPLKLQKQCPVTILNSYYIDSCGNRWEPCLATDGVGRGLYICNFDDDRDAHNCFFGVQK